MVNTKIPLGLLRIIRYMSPTKILHGQIFIFYFLKNNHYKLYISINRYRAYCSTQTTSDTFSNFLKPILIYDLFYCRLG